MSQINSNTEPENQKGNGPVESMGRTGNKNPFKFLDAYTKNDREIFFGRSEELDEIYRKFYKSKILLVYGKSGTGKSSIINCGLVSKIPAEDILIIPVRCSKDPVNNLKADLRKFSDSDSPDTIDILKDIYEKNFKPVSLIFDQFEEIFILSTLEERKKLISELLKIIQSKIRVNLVLIFREEYFAGFSEFEDVIPNLYSNRVRIEKLNKNVVEEIIEKPCRSCNVQVETGLSKKVTEILSRETGQIELTWFQILMDKLYKLAIERDQINPSLKISDLHKIGDIGNILGDFLNEQLLGMENAPEVEAVLKTMISEDGTKKQITLDEIVHSLDKANRNIPGESVRNILKNLVDRRIISEKDEHGNYEIKHDSLAIRIYERLTAEERKLKEIQQLIKNAHNQYLQVGTLMNEQMLKHIGPYTTNLSLPIEQEKFVKQSENEIGKAKRRIRNTVFSLGTFILIFAIVFGIYSYKGRQKAELEARISKSKELANQALLYCESDPTKAYLIAEQAFGVYPTFESKSAILNAYKNAPFYNRIDGNQFVLSKSENYILVTNTLDHIIRIYDFTGDLMAICKGHKGPILNGSLKFSDDEKYIVSESVIDSSVRIWDIAGKEIFKVNKGGYKQLGFLPDNKLYIISNIDYQLYNIDGIQIMNVLFEKPARQIFIDSLYALLVTHDSIMEIKSLNNFITIIKGEKINDLYYQTIFDARNKIVIYRTTGTIYKLWNWEQNHIYDLSDKMNDPTRYFRIKNDYLIDRYKANISPGKFKIRNAKTGQIIYESLENVIFIWKTNFIDKVHFIIPDYEKSALYDIRGQIIRTFSGKLEDYYSQTGFLITIKNESNIQIYHISGRQVASVALKDVLFCKFIDKDKFIVCGKDNRISVFNTNGRLLYTLKGVPIKSTSEWSISTYFIKNSILIIKTDKGLYSYTLNFEKQNRLNESYNWAYYTHLIGNEYLFRVSWFNNINLLNTRLQKLKIPDSAIKYIDFVKFSPDKKYFLVVENQHDTIGKATSILSLFSFPDCKILYSQKSSYNPNLIDRTNYGIEFLNSNDTSCLIYHNGVLRYLDNKFKIINEWKISNLRYCGFNDYFNSGMSINNGFLIGLSNLDSCIRIYDLKHRDSIPVNKMSNIYDSDKLTFINEGNQLLYYNQAKNEVNLLNKDFDTLDVIYPSGKKVLRINEYGDLLFISSVDVEYSISPGNLIWKNEVQSSYLQVYNMVNKTTIFKDFSSDALELVYDYSPHSKLISIIDKPGPGKVHPISSYIDVRNLMDGKSLIKFETETYSNFSEDGKYINIYQSDYDKLIVFPLDATEVIERVREFKEYGNIPYSEVLHRNTNSLNLINDSSLNITNSTTKLIANREIKNKDDLEKVLRLFKLKQDWDNFYSIAKENIKTYYWNDYDKLAEVSNSLIDKVGNNELDEIFEWVNRSVHLQSYIYNNLLLSKIYFKLCKNEEALRVIRRTCFQNISKSSTFLSSDYFEELALYDYFGPDYFVTITKDLIKMQPDDSDVLNEIAWYYYEHVEEKSLLDYSVDLIKESISLNKNPQNLDTYSALLYKLGNFKKALDIESEAVVLAKKTKQDFNQYEIFIEKINDAKDSR
jgi:Fe2+ or Zn2+ uptake regulation protein/energy-coupling factor transporter ATP-binding protein EcfA2